MNYYALEPILLARLQSACPSIGDVQGAADLFGLTELCQNAKASTKSHHPVLNPTGDKHGGAYVMFFEETVTQTTKDCDRADQTWIVAVCAKKLQKLRTGVEARQEDGYLVNQVLQALRGWDYGSDIAAAHNAALPAGTPPMLGARRRLERVTCPINRMQLVGMGQNDGLTVTLLAYKAKDLII